MFKLKKDKVTTVMDEVQNGNYEYCTNATHKKIIDRNTTIKYDEIIDSNCISRVNLAKASMKDLEFIDTYVNLDNDSLVPGSKLNYCPNTNYQNQLEELIDSDVDLYDTTYKCV